MAELRLPRRYPDPAESTEPDVQELLAALRALPPGRAAPRAEFRTELRAQLVAVAPQLANDAAAEPKATAPAAPRHRLRRVAIVVGGLVSVSAVVLGLLVWFSGKALPGDPLYGIKRAREDVQLSLAGGSVARGKQYLDQAGTRADEVLQVWTHSIDAAHPPTVASEIPPRANDLMADTLNDADSATRDGSRLIGTNAVASRSADALNAVLNWAPGQVRLLTAISKAIPAGALHDRAVASAQLAGDALQRAVTLRSEMGCGCLASAPVDALGPVPCGTCASSTPSSPGPSTPVVPSNGTSGASGSSSTTAGGSPSASSAAVPNATNNRIVPTPAAQQPGGAGAHGQPAPTPSPGTTSAPSAAPPLIAVSGSCVSATVILGVTVCLPLPGG